MIEAVAVVSLYFFVLFAGSGMLTPFAVAAKEDA